MQGISGREYIVDIIDDMDMVLLCFVVLFVILPGPRLNLKTVFLGMGVSIMKIR